MSPVRVQLSRAKGWRMPPNTVKVDRTTVFGNPWSIKGVRAWLKSVNVPETFSDERRAENCVYNYRLWVEKGLPVTYPHARSAILRRLPDLRGKNLACWCKPGAPCHADVLLELANANPQDHSDGDGGHKPSAMANSGTSSTPIKPFASESKSK